MGIIALLKRPLRIVRRLLPPANFITIHYSYFIGTCLLWAVIFWGSSTPARSVSFVDSLFLTVSAMTLAGLNTVNLSELNTFQQVILFCLIMLGSAIWVSSFVVHVRKRAFEKKLKDVIAQGKHTRGRSRSRHGLSGSWSMGRRSSEASRQEELQDLAEKGEPANAHDLENLPAGDDMTRPFSTLNGQDDRSQTPPARRGGPEMNGISSKTGEVLSETESEQVVSPDRSTQPGITFRGDTRFAPAHQSPQSPRPRSNSIFTMQGVGARRTSSLQPSSPMYEDDLQLPPPQQPSARSRGDIGQYFEAVGGWLGRNSQFHGLNEKEREKLGGYEYRAVSFLAWLVPAYFILWQLLGGLGCAAWVAHHAADTTRQNGLNPWWVGAFNAVSAFNNSGMSLLDANMVAFQRGYYILITMSLLILAGNTCYPIFLRLIVWCMWKALVTFRYFTNRLEWEEQARTLRFLLDHPRRCYTNFFPAQHTWWLLLSVVTLNSVDWAAFEILNIDNHALYDSLPERYRVIDGLFQAVAVRSGGFYVVTISSLRISLQVLYVVMMYISVYPVVITMRNSNVYEERSLGIYTDDQENYEGGQHPTGTDTEPAHGGGLLRRALTIRDHIVAGGAAAKESNSHFVRQQLRAQLAHDAWWIVLALFLIMIIEGSQFNADPATFSVFNFIFEIVSGYGCVGISVGVPWAAYSFCGSWHALSKVILCAVMLRGRHRGLPVAIDKAVLLPGEGNWRAEEEDGRIRLGLSLIHI